MRKSVFLKVIGYAGLLSLSLSLAGQPPVSGVAAGKIQHHRGGITGSYMIVLRDDAVARSGSVADSVAGLAQAVTAAGAHVSHRFLHVLHAVSVRVPDDATLQRIAALPSVAYVEQMSFHVPSGQQVNPENWGLDRIDQRDRPLNQTYDYTTTGAGVSVYVVDTGIDFSRSDFANKVPRGFDAYDAVEIPNAYADDYESWDTDCKWQKVGQAWVTEGHGTQVAAIATGSIHGVAKDAKLYSVKIWPCQVFQGSGPTEEASIAGFDWIAGTRYGPAVVNYSFNRSDPNNPYSVSFLTAVQSLINSGVSFVWSAGDHESVTDVPIGAAISVGATTPTDGRVFGTSYGADVYAPGADVLTAKPYSSSPVYFNLTSAAAPFVTGAVARYLQSNPTATPAQVKSYILSSASTGKVQGIPAGGYPNRLLYIAP